MPPLSRDGFFDSIGWGAHSMLEPFDDYDDASEWGVYEDVYEDASEWGVYHADEDDDEDDDVLFDEYFADTDDSYFDQVVDYNHEDGGGGVSFEENELRSDIKAHFYLKFCKQYPDVCARIEQGFTDAFALHASFHDAALQSQDDKSSEAFARVVIYCYTKKLIAYAYKMMPVLDVQKEYKKVFMYAVDILTQTSESSPDNS